LKLGFVTEAEFDRLVDAKKMVRPNVAASIASATQRRNRFTLNRLRPGFL